MWLDESTSKINNDTSILQTENNINFNIKLKLNRFENLNEPKFNEGIDSSVLCELKINDTYEKGYLRLKNNCLLVLRNKI